MEENFKKCKYCQSDIDVKAKICPKCGKKQGMKTWVIVLIVIAVIIVLGSLSSSSENSNTVTNSNNSENVVESNSNNTTQNTQQNKKYSVGETYKDSKVDIAYLELDENFTGYSNYATVKDGYKVVKATFEFTNNSPSDFLASAYDFNCYADGYDCESFWSVDGSGFSATLSSNKKTKGTVYFEVPENSSEIEIEYEVSYWSNKKVIFKVK